MNNLERIDLGGACDLKRKIASGLAKNARTLVIISLLFTIVVVMTTNLKFITLTEVKDLGLQFFFLLFASYAMYFTCSGGGTANASATEAYITAKTRFKELHDKILNEDLQTRLGEFCEHYVAEDLKQAQLFYLAPAGLSYAEYKRWATFDDKDLSLVIELSEVQRLAIKRANSVKPIRLTPGMLLRELDHSATHRSPFGINPHLKRKFVFGGQFAKMTLISIGATFIALELIIEPSWTVFATVLLKLASVIFIGFSGYEDGYNYIVVDAVGYISNQVDLMTMAIRYIESHHSAKHTVLTE